MILRSIQFKIDVNQINSMNRKTNSEEILTYFSQFLNQINIIIANIKIQMYNLIDIRMPSPKTYTAFNQISSIIFSTHQTYSDLRKVQSLLAGYTRSHKSVKGKNSLNSPILAFKRSKSLQTPLSYQFDLSHLSRLSEKTDSVTNFTIKQISLRNRQYQYEEQGGLINLNNQNLNVKPNFIIQKQSLSTTVQHKQDDDQRKLIENKIKNMTNKNRLVFQQIINQNNQCLDMINQAKQLIISSE